MLTVLYQVGKFFLVGLLNTTVGLLAIYALMFMWNINAGWANFLGYLIGLGVSFSLNRTWTFRDDQEIARTLPIYLMVAAASYLLNLTVVLSVIHYSDLSAYFAQLFGIFFYTVSMFIACRLIVFRKTTGQH
jgi:putative flippase GtrA